LIATQCKFCINTFSLIYSHNNVNQQKNNNIDVNTVTTGTVLTKVAVKRYWIAVNGSIPWHSLLFLSKRNGKERVSSRTTMSNINHYGDEEYM